MDDYDNDMNSKIATTAFSALQARVALVYAHEGITNVGGGLRCAACGLDEAQMWDSLNAKPDGDAPFQPCWRGPPPSVAWAGLGKRPPDWMEWMDGKHPDCLPYQKNASSIVGRHIRSAPHVQARVLWESDQWVVVVPQLGGNCTSRVVNDALLHCFSFLDPYAIWLVVRHVCRQWKLCCDATPQIEAFLQYRQQIEDARYVPLYGRAAHYGNSAMQVAAGTVGRVAGGSLMCAGVLLMLPSLAVGRLVGTWHRERMHLTHGFGRFADYAINISGRHTEFPSLSDEAAILSNIDSIVDKAVVASTAVPTIAAISGVLLDTRSLRLCNDGMAGLGGILFDGPLVPSLSSYQERMAQPTTDFEKVSLENYDQHPV